MDVPERTRQALREHRAFMVRVARSMVSDDALAEDAVQEASLRALERPPPHAESLRSWLALKVRRVTVEMIRSEKRRKRREQTVARERGLAISEAPSTEAVREAVEAALADLREPFRTTMTLRLRDGLSPSQIAERCALPIETVRSQLQRGKKQLREDLDRRLGGRDQWMAPLLVFLDLPNGGVGVPRPTTLLRGGALGAGLLVATAAVVATWMLAFRDAGLEAPAVNPPELADGSAALEGRTTVAAPRLAQEAATPEAPAPVDTRHLVVRCLDASGAALHDAAVYVQAADHEYLLQPLEEHGRRYSVVGERARLPFPDEPVFIAATAQGRMSRDVVRVLPSAPDDYEIVLYLDTVHALKGKVIDGFGRPVDGADVELVLNLPHRLGDSRVPVDGILFHDGLEARTRTDVGGEFELYAHELRFRRLLATKAGHSAAVARGVKFGGELELVLDQDIDVVVGASLDGVPQEGITVELFHPNLDAPHIDVTGQDGTCTITTPDALEFIARLTRPDVMTMVVRHGNKRPLLPLMKAGAGLGRIVDHRGEPIKGAKLHALLSMQLDMALQKGFPEEVAREIASAWEVTSGSDGQFSFPHRGGPLFIQVDLPGSDPSFTVRHRDGRDDLDLTIPDIDERAKVTLRVANPSGEPVSEYRYRAFSLVDQDQVPGPWNEVRDPGGRAVIEEAARQTYFLEIAADGYYPARCAPPCREGSCELDVELGKSRAIEVEFVDSRGNPLPRARVLVRDQGMVPIMLPYLPGRIQSRFITDEQGRYQLRGVPARELHLRVVLTSFREPLAVILDLREEDREQVTLSLPCNASPDRRSVEFELIGCEGQKFGVIGLDVQGTKLFDQQFRWRGTGPHRTIKDNHYHIRYDGRRNQMAGPSARDQHWSQASWRHVEGKTWVVSLPMPASEPSTLIVEAPVGTKTVEVSETADRFVIDLTQ